MGIKSIALVASTLVLSTSVNAATLSVDGAGILTGATDVDVGGSLYDVYFMDGSCNSLFNGCTEFTFTDHASAGLASQALLDQVFIGVYDTDPNKTNGIEFPGNGPQGSIHTPFALSQYGDDVVTRMATNNEYVDFDTVSDDQLRAFDDDFTSKYYAVYAVWTEAGAGAPISSVPIPAAAWLFGSGLIGLLGLARRKS